MKEHSGGSPDVGYIPIDNWDEGESFAVPIEQFDYSKLDKPEDFIIEAVKQGRDIRPILRGIVASISGYKVAATMALLLAEIQTAKKPRMIADQIIWATGMNLLNSAGCEEIAKSYGISKQAFVQGAHRLCERLDLKANRNMRDSKARAKMSANNYRK